MRFIGVLGDFNVVPIGFMQFLLKQLNWFCVKYCFKYDGIFCVICLFHRRWNNETDRKMIRYVTFKNGSFKDSVSERVCENMVYCGCRFSRNSSWFVYCWFLFFLFERISIARDSMPLLLILRSGFTIKSNDLWIYIEAPSPLRSPLAWCVLL